MNMSSIMRGCASFAILAGALGGASAYAQPVDRTSDWTGFYVGGQIGYEDGSADHSFSNGAPSDDSEPSGFVGGAHGGYNWRHENVVFGIEADANGGNVEGDFTNLTGATSVGEVDVNWEASLRGRLGVVNGANLFYFTAGAAWLDADFGGGPAPGPACCGYSDTQSGWTAGVGFERIWNGAMTYRVEYRYAEYDDASGALAPAFPGVTMPVELDSNSLYFGLSYHF